MYLEGHTGIPGLWTQELDAGLWTLDAAQQTFQRRFNVVSKQRCQFQRRFSQRWATSKQRYEYDHLKKI